MRRAGPATHVVLAQFCDAWRDPVDGRPADLPIGWVTPVGQPLVRYGLELASGRSVEGVMRRRFEINEGIVGWGQGAFAAVPHHVDTPLDWRGPYPAAAPGGYAEPGHAGLLGILPGSWGPAQTGVSDSVPSPTGDIALWLHVIEIPDGPSDLARLRLEPVAPLDAGAGVVVAAITAFRGTASPLALEPRRTLRLEDDAGVGSVAVDLGQVFRERPAPVPIKARSDVTPAIAGWGTPRTDDGSTSGVLVDLAMAADATIVVRGERVSAARLPADGARRRFGAVTIESLPARTQRVDVEVVDALTGEPVPSRVRFEAADGRYLQPLGHRDEINPGLNEDTGADLVLGGATYAYVPGRFPIELPVGDVQVEVVRGFGYRPLRLSVDSTVVVHRWSCRSSRSTGRPGPAGSPSTATSISSHRRRRSSRREPRAWPSSTCWPRNGETTTRASPTCRLPSSRTHPASTWWSWAARTARTCSATSASSVQRMPCCRWRAPAHPKRAWATRSTG